MGSERSSGRPVESLYFPELDGLRFFAFLLVFVHHHPLFGQIPGLGIFHDFGWIGVDLFFALSAFLFTRLLIAEYDKTQTISFRKFYARRLFRIWPIYFLYILFITSCYFLKMGPFSGEVVRRLVGLVTFTDNIISAFRGYCTIPYTGHLWTIAYEEQFYIFIPLLVYFLVRSSTTMKLLVFFSTVLLFNAIRLVMLIKQVPHPAIWVLPVTHFESIVIGIAVGFGAFSGLQKRIHPLIVALCGAAAFFMVSKMPMVQEDSYWLPLTYSLIGIATSLLLYAVLKSDLLRNFFSKPLLVYLGKRSYGLYVYHLFGNRVAEGMVNRIPGLPANTLIYFLLSLTFIVLISIISYALIETPFLRLKKQFEVILSRPV